MRAALVLALLLTGCSLSQLSAAPPAAPLSNASAVHRSAHAGSWMARGLKNRDLLYVSNSNGTVNVYRYWQRTLGGVLTDFQEPLGECADFAGHVYIVDYQAGKVLEYAHGGEKPIRVLHDSAPYGCSVSSSNGNLAVAAFGATSGREDYYATGNITVYPHGTGDPIVYQAARGDHFVACAYDNRGDLLATSQRGYSHYYSTEFYYLPKKGTQLILMDLADPSRSYGWDYVSGLAWDGKYWVVDSFYLYQYTINVKAQYVNTIKISEGGELGPVWIYRKSSKSLGTQVVGGTGESSENVINYWSYPSGGDPIHDITKDLDAPSGVAVSLGTQ